MKTKLLETLRGMSEQEVYSGLYTDPLTGVLNRRAFSPADDEFIGLVDLDSLKYINDTLGHREGDRYLVSVAAALASVFGIDNTYRISGDEFVVIGNDPHLLNGWLRRVQDVLGYISFGIGRDIESADRWLKKDKHSRESIGIRAPRGERPARFDGPKGVFTTEYGQVLTWDGERISVTDRIQAIQERVMAAISGHPRDAALREARIALDRCEADGLMVCPAEWKTATDVNVTLPGSVFDVTLKIRFPPYE